MNCFDHDGANYMYFRKCHNHCEFKKKKDIISATKY